MKQYLLLLLISVVALTACEKDNLTSVNSSVLKVSPKQALISVELDAEDLPKGSKEIGIAYAKSDEFSNQSYTYTDPIEEADIFSPTFKTKLVHLECGTAYTYCVYVKTNKGTKMGAPFHFNTEPLPQYAVDLGLSNDLLWADRNLGATNPEEGGDHYAWGETEPKTIFSISNYKFWIQGGETGTPYAYSKYTIPDGWRSNLWYDEKGVFIGDNKHVLESEDDAVTYKWGGQWRMPYPDEFELLVKECDVINSTNPEQNGVTVKAPNNNSIHFPNVMPAEVEQIDGVYVPEDCEYWTKQICDMSTLTHITSNKALTFIFWHRVHTNNMTSDMARFGNGPIRGVYDCNL